MRGSHRLWSGLCCSMSLCPSCSCWCGVHSVQAAAAACCPSDLRAETGAGVPRRPARPAAASRHGTRILGIRTRRTEGRGRAGEGKVFITVGLHTFDTYQEVEKYIFCSIHIYFNIYYFYQPITNSLFSLLSNAFAIIFYLQT